MPCALLPPDHAPAGAPRPWRLLLLFLALWPFSLPLHAMEFQPWTHEGHPSIVGLGEIVPGDDARLRAMLTPANRHPRGHHLLILHSPGGQVEAAFAMARVMDAANVHTQVPDRARCASACAAIVFMAGQEHVVRPGGLLGFHGCVDVRTRRIAPACNERIAEHAVEHGTAWGSVMAFIAEVPADELIWIDHEGANCWALNRHLITPEPPDYEGCVFRMIKEVTRRARAAKALPPAASRR